MTERFVPWFDGILVTESDRAALDIDLMVFGNAYVEATGDGRGRRISPKDIFVAASGEREPKEG